MDKYRLGGVKASNNPSALASNRRTDMAATVSSLANKIMTLAVPSEYSNVTSSTTYKMKKEVIFFQNDDNCHAPSYYRHRVYVSLYSTLSLT